MEVIKQKLNIVKTSFSLRLFLKGVVGVFVLYAAIFGYFYYKSPSLEKKQIETLPSKTTIIRNTEFSTDIVIHDAGHSDPDKAGVQPLGSVPVTGLYEKGKVGGVKPIIREADNLMPFNAYKRPYDIRSVGTKPVISLGLFEAGTSKAATETALKQLPPEVSFILSPYTPDIDYWVRQSRSYGHEVWLILPMETVHYPRHDFGAHTLLTQTPIRENMDKLNWVLESTVGYTGFVTPYDATFIESLEDARPILRELGSRGLGFINASKYSSAVMKKFYLSMNAPYGHTPVWIDMPPSKTDIQQKLEELEKQARRTGHASAIFNAFPVSYQEIIKWNKTLKEKGIVLAPLSVEAEL